MSSLQNMIDLLRPTGLYRLTADSHVMRELKAYAVGLDHLALAFDELIREGFVQTAQGDGLAFWERKLGLSALTGDTEARRRRLMSLLCLSDDDFTKDDILRTLDALGAKVEITEYFIDELLYITGKGYIGAGGSAADIAQELKKILPAHLDGEMSIHVGSWYFWDSRGKTFIEWDQTGNSFDTYAAMAMIGAEL